MPSACLPGARPYQGLGLTLTVHEGAEGVCLPRGEPGQWTMRVGVRAAAAHDRARSSDLVATS